MDVGIRFPLELHLSTGPSNNRQWDLQYHTASDTTRNLVVCVLSQPILRYKLLETMGDYQERLVKSGLWCNGNTTGFGPVIPRSNRSSPTIGYLQIYLITAHNDKFHILTSILFNDSIAQQVEQRPFKAWGLGPSPSGITI